MKRFIRSLLPRRVFTFFQPLYHYLLSITGALLYRFPSRKLIVIGVTGTKGKSSTVELVNSILEEAGYTTALLSTIRFKIAGEERRNTLKMTMPGLFFIQNLLRDAVSQKCTHAVLEMTSEGVKQFRHKYIDLDALIFTNITPEHIESHGSFEKYLEAKLKLRDSLERSPKKNTAIIANADDEHGKDFLEVSRAQKIPFSLNDIAYAESPDGLQITYKDTLIQSKLEGVFNAENILAAIKLAEHLGVSLEDIKKGVENVSLIRGRVEHVNVGQLFDVVVDYAHTTDSLEKLYKTFPNKKKICVL
ncbi:Mur ligase family protein, partial [candidate division KSB1 bacterium]